MTISKIWLASEGYVVLATNPRTKDRYHMTAWWLVLLI